MTHAAYWKHLRFKDPCQKDDQKQFEMCNHYCRSEDHASVTATSQQRSFCTEKLWHQPVSRTGTTSNAGYVTKDGHAFGCNHMKNAPGHVIFVIDRSGSMGSSDAKPTLAMFAASFNNRLGCVYEAVTHFIRTRVAGGQPDVVSIVLFDHRGTIAVERQTISESLVDNLLNHYSVGGGTVYSAGLHLIQQILHRAALDASMQAKHPAVIFLSDGGNLGGTEPVSMVKNMKDFDHTLVFHTILFGTDNSQEDVLERMASAGGGTHQVSIDEVQLARSFEGLAKSLRPKVASLM